MNDIKIRHATPADAQMLADFNANIASETENIKLIPEVILAGVKRLIDDRGLGFYLVAENREIIASLMVTNEWSDWRNGVFWWIQSVYVVKSWRRKNVYSQLYQMVKQLADEQPDVCGYRLYVEQENTIAQSVYRNVGMNETHYRLYEELKPSLRFCEEAS